MLPADIGALPPAMAFVVILAALLLRFYKQRGDQKSTEWDRMRDLLDENRSQRDRDAALLAQKDDLIEQQAAHITQLRADLREALRNLDHTKDPT